MGGGFTWDTQKRPTSPRVNIKPKERVFDVCLWLMKIRGGFLFIWLRVIFSDVVENQQIFFFFFPVNGWTDVLQA